MVTVVGSDKRLEVGVDLAEKHFEVMEVYSFVAYCMAAYLELVGRRRRHTERVWSPQW